MSRAPIAGPFLFNVAGLMAEPPGTRRVLPIAGATIPLDDDLRLSDPIEGRIELDRTNRGLIVHARVSTALEASCGRCLRPVSVPIEIDLREEVLPSVELTTGAPIETDAEPDVLRLTDHHELDLEPTIRAEISLREPIAALCRPDCPGLCLTCGEHLESGDHDHPDDEIDPRLAALRAFQPDDDEAEPAD